MPIPDWLLMVNRDGLVEAVDGGAPLAWIRRRIDECQGLPEAVRSAARALVRELAQPRADTLLRRVLVPAESPSGPSYTLLAVEAILLRPAEIDLAPFVRRALEPLARQAEADGVTLRLAMADNVPPRAAVDPPKIAWVVTALVGNALRYVRRGRGGLPGGHIVVQVAQGAVSGLLSITVEDDGPGMDADVHARLLAPNGDGDASGVSLRLVHDVVAAHGGGMVIRSSSAPADRGTTVTLWLPVRG